MLQFKINFKLSQTSKPSVRSALPEDTTAARRIGVTQAP